MKIGDKVEHINKESKSGYPHDRKYVFLGVCRCKDKKTGDWYDAAMYQDNVIFVRELEDFNNKFKKVEE